MATTAAAGVSREAEGAAASGQPPSRPSGGFRMPEPSPPPRYLPEMPLPPYAYVPGHGLPHPVNDPDGHSHGHTAPAAPITPEVLARLPADAASRRRALAALLASSPQWLRAIDLFNEGFAWEAHEAWEGFWNALGRTTREARLVQGLIHLAAACVKIREGRPAGVATHARRARELVDGPGDYDASGAGHGPAPACAAMALGLDPASLEAVMAELEAHRPACWHTARVAGVKVVAAGLKVAR